MRLVLIAAVAFGVLCLGFLTASIWTAESFGLSDKLGATGFVAFIVTVLVGGAWDMERT